MNAVQSLRRAGAVASAASLLIVGIGATTAAAAGATISGTPASTYIRQGDTMSLSGTCAGLTGETGYVAISATYYGEDVPDEGFFVDLDDNGAWSVESTVLEDATVGDWLFTAQCVNYDLADGASASTGWTVLSALSGVMSDTTMSVSGQTSQVSATGFAPGEIVSIYLDGELLASATAGPDGTVVGDLELAGYPLGAHTLRLVGEDSAGVVEIEFSVVADPATPEPTNPATPEPTNPVTPAPKASATPAPAAPAATFKPTPVASANTGLPRAASDVVL